MGCRARYLNEREARGDRSDPGFGVLVPWSLHTQLLMLVARAAGAGILFDHAMLERPRTEQ
jgi:hypothetical protein